MHCIFIFPYGDDLYSIRLSDGLIYAVYRYNKAQELPDVHGQHYAAITREQFDWLYSHLQCYVYFESSVLCGWEVPGNLYCQTCNARQSAKLFTLSAEDIYFEERVV